jgi:TatD DNase family protein
VDLVDSHCHLDAEAFAHDREAVIDRARAAGVRRQVVPAVTAASWPGLRQACRLAAGLYPAYGLHPVYLDQHRPEHLDQLQDWIERERPLAIGECGLDYFMPGLDAAGQARYFDAQLRLARDHDLPVIVHARRAVDAVIAAIRRIGGAARGQPSRLRGVVHSFSGSPEQARRLWELGFCIGLGGPLTHVRAQRLHRLVAEMPLEFLLLETDAPDQPDAGISGQRNEPARLPVILKAVAQLRQADPVGIARATTANAERLFALPGAETA